jgi:hypothetical protein
MLKVGQVIHFTLTNNPVNEYDAKIYSIGTHLKMTVKPFQYIVLYKEIKQDS